MLFTLLLLTSLTLTAHADEVFVRNRPVQGAISQNGLLWIPTADLRRYFSDPEMKRVEVSPEAVSVDGRAVCFIKTLNEKPCCALENVAGALGFRRVPNAKLSSIDFFPPAPPAAVQPATFHKKGLTKIPDSESELKHNDHPTWRDPKKEDSPTASETPKLNDQGKPKASFSGKGLDDEP